MAHRDTWETYAAAWKTRDPAERARLLAASVHEDCVYTDPLMQAEGSDALMAYMDAFQQQIPGGGFVTDTFEMHHDHSLVCWKMVDGEGATAGTGTSFGTYGEDGRLRTMTGFFATGG